MPRNIDHPPDEEVSISAVVGIYPWSFDGKWTGLLE